MRRLLVTTGLATLVLAVPAQPVGAHPFGPPPTAVITADEHTVVIQWRSAADDAVAVGAEIGLASDDMVDAYLEAATQAAPPGHVEDDITESDELRDYLTEHIVVRQDGEACDAQVQPIENFVWEGATVAHRCPEPIGAVEIEISMLHDRHSAYRTFAIGAETADPPHAVFTDTDPSTEWDFSEALGQGVDGDPEERLAEAGDEGGGAFPPGAAAWPVAALLAGVGAASGAAAWRSRRQRAGAS